MEIRGQRAIDQFCRQHPTARGALKRWVSIVREASWKNFAAVRGDFGAADLVGRYVVFNVGGNKFRLVAQLNYELSLVLVREVLTHAEYDKGRWKRL